MPMFLPSEPERTTDDVWQVIFGMGIADPKSWVDVGTRLIRAGIHIVEISEAAGVTVAGWFAELAEAPPGTGRHLSDEEQGILTDAATWPIGWLLIGYGLENLAKAIIIGRDTAEARRASALPRSLDTHGLPKLMETALGHLEAGETRFLETLKEHVTWLGRYPVPKTWEQLREQQVQRRIVGSQMDARTSLQALMQRINEKLIPST